MKSTLHLTVSYHKLYRFAISVIIGSLLLGEQSIAKNISDPAATPTHLCLLRPSGTSIIPLDQCYPATQILLRTTLYGTDSYNTKTYLADGVLNEFDSSYRDTLNRSQDISKLFNFNEKVAIYNYSTYLSIERSPLAEDGTVINLYVSGLKQSQPYQFVIQTTNFTRPDLNAFFVDSFTHAYTPILLGDTLVNVNFSITSDPNSYASDRFHIIFRFAPGSVAYDTVMANSQNKDITVQWQVSSQLNIKEYVIEKSIDSINFYPVDTTIANTGTSSAYSWLDTDGVIGNNYYRIRSIDNTEETTYNKIVNAVVTNTIVAPATVVSNNVDIAIYPNPVTNGIVQLKTSNMPVGEYGIKIINTSGWVLLSENIDHSVPNETESIIINKNLIPGIYMMEIIYPDKSVVNKTFELQ
jgi:hypothetical protein